MIELHTFHRAETTVAALSQVAELTAAVAAFAWAGAVPTTARDSGQPRAVTTEIRNVTVVDGTGAPPESRRTVIVKGGLTIATRNSAASLGRLDEMGTIAPGKRADLVLLDANPLDDIANTRRIAAVIADGRVYSRQQIEALLAETARQGPLR
jgi:predicted amidohydrolase YtcJ